MIITERSYKLVFAAIFLLLCFVWVWGLNTIDEAHPPIFLNQNSVNIVSGADVSIPQYAGPTPQDFREMDKIFHKIGFTMIVGYGCIVLFVAYMLISMLTMPSLEERLGLIK